MGQQLLSTDPRAGQLLSTDPSAGVYQQPDLVTATPPALVSAGGRGTRLDVNKSDEFGQGFFSAMPFGPDTPDSAGGTAGRVAGTAAMVAYPATRIAEAIYGAGGALAAVRAGGRELLAQTAPAVKYEVTKAALEHMGVPSTVSVPLAIAVSGYKRGAKPTISPPAAATESAAVETAVPVESPPVVPGSPTAEAVPQSASISTEVPKWSPQRIRNEVGIAEKRAGLTLTEVQRSAADQMVKQGILPQRAVQLAGGSNQAAATAAMAAAPKPSLSATEVRAYQQMRATGASHDDAIKAIEAGRALMSKFGTPSLNDVKNLVAQRNATGRWPTK